MDCTVSRTDAERARGGGPAGLAAAAGAEVACLALPSTLAAAPPSLPIRCSALRAWPRSRSRSSSVGRRHTRMVPSG